MLSEKEALAETIRRACLQAALEAYEQARMDGLCAEGALEIALDAIRRLDVGRLVVKQLNQEKETS